MALDNPASGASTLRPLHVGKFIPPPFAGIEAHIDGLLRAMAPAVDATLVACRAPGSTPAPVARPYRLIPATSLGKLASTAVSPDFLWRIRREMASGRCNLLHLHAPNPWGDAAALTCANDRPVVLTWHSDIVQQQRLLRLYGGVQRRVLQRADKIIVFTPAHYASSTQLHQVDVAAKIEVVPMGIAVERLDAARAGALPPAIQSFVGQRPVVLTIGRHVYYKGYAHLIDAFKGVARDAVLVMVGTGPLSPALQTQIAENGLVDRVLMTGELDESTLIALLHRCDVFTLPSIEPSEAFGIASAEAMACGKPTVVCELGNGVNYLNRHGVTGLTVAPRDVAALADALNQLVGDAAMRQTMGSAAAAWIHTNFTTRAMADRTIEIYRRLT